jgi:general secretion pathway protein K
MAVRSPFPFPARTRASVIVLVLALVALAAFLLSAFIERASTELLVETRAHQSGQLRAEAYSALETTLAVLATYQVEDNGLRSPAQGWGDPLAGTDFKPRDGVQVAVEFEDETGKLSLPRLDARGLEDLGLQIGLTELDAARFADALLGWTQRDHVTAQYEADPRKYEYENPPHRAPGRAIESFGELAAIAIVRDLLFNADGTPNERHERLVQAVSLYEFPAVNLNAARTAALLAAGVDPSQASRLTDFNSGRGRSARDANEYFRNIAEAQTVLGSVTNLSGFDTLVQVLRIRVTVRQGGSALRLTALVRPGSSNNNAAAAGGTAGGDANRPQAPGADAAAQDASASTAPALQYPFTILTLDESVDLQTAPNP